MLAGFHGGTIWALAAEYVSGPVWGRMLHIGCECWDGASVSLTLLSNASVQCSPSFHPSIRPPPLSSSNKWSFCSTVFAAVGRRASAGLSPKTLLKLFSIALYNLCLFYVAFFILFLTFFGLLHKALNLLHAIVLLLLHLFILLHSLRPRLTRRLTDFWNSSPPFCSLHVLLLTCFLTETSSLVLAKTFCSETFLQRPLWAQCKYDRNLKKKKKSKNA